MEWGVCHWPLQTCFLPVDIFSCVVVNQVSAASSHGFPWPAMCRLICFSLQLQCKVLVLGT